MSFARYYRSKNLCKVKVNQAVTTLKQLDPEYKLKMDIKRSLHILYVYADLDPQPLGALIKGTPQDGQAAHSASWAVGN